MDFTIPTAKDLGLVSAEPYYRETHLAGMVERGLTRLGFEVYREVMAAPKFPGFLVGSKPPANLPRNKDGLPIDVLAHKDRLTLLIETKMTPPQGGIGQLLLYEAIYRANRLPEDQELVPILAAPDTVWHPRLPAICEAIGIVPWLLVTGRVKD